MERNPTRKFGKWKIMWKGQVQAQLYHLYQLAQKLSRKCLWIWTNVLCIFYETTSLPVKISKHMNAKILQYNNINYFLVCLNWETTMILWICTEKRLVENAKSDGQIYRDFAMFVFSPYRIWRAKTRNYLNQPPYSSPFVVGLYLFNHQMNRYTSQ